MKEATLSTQEGIEVIAALMAVTGSGGRSGTWALACKLAGQWGIDMVAEDVNTAMTRNANTVVKEWAEHHDVDVLEIHNVIVPVAPAEFSASMFDRFYKEF